MTEIALRDMHPDEGPVLEALQLRASLVWEQYRADLEAHPEAVALPAGAIVRVAAGAGGAPLGFSVLLAASGQTWELDGLFVEPAQQHRGVGRRLIADAVARARGGGASCLEVVAGPATAFYERVGFVLVGETETQFGPAVTLRRAL